MVCQKIKSAWYRREFDYNRRDEYSLLFYNKHYIPQVVWHSEAYYGKTPNRWVICTSVVITTQNSNGIL